MSGGARLLYLTYNENPVESGILQTQVVRLLEMMASSGKLKRIRLLSLLSPRLIARLGDRLNELNERLSGAGVEFSWRLMHAATAWGWPTIPILRWEAFPQIIAEAEEFRPTLIHTRSYAAGWLGRLAARELGVPHIFDPRGSYPEEMVANGVWRRRGISFRIWKRLESQIVREAAAVVGVTPLFCADYKSLGALRTAFIPNRAEIGRFEADANGRVDRAPLAVFIGEMDSKWYSPEFIGRNFLKLKNVQTDLKLLVVTRRDREYIARGFASAGVADRDWEHRAATPAEIPSILKEASIGLLLQDFDNSWPVKFAEYLAAGLPIVMNRRREQLMTGLIEKHRLGLVVDADRPETFGGLKELLIRREEFSSRCVEFARNRMQLETSALQYLRLYRTVGRD